MKTENKWDKVFCDKGASVIKNGWPDRIYSLNGYYYLVEIKSPKEPLLRSQETLHQVLKQKGIVVNIVRNEKDLKNLEPLISSNEKTEIYKKEACYWRQSYQNTMEYSVEKLTKETEKEMAKESSVGQ